jgi:hypothetical protein
VIFIFLLFRIQVLRIKVRIIIVCCSRAITARYILHLVRVVNRIFGTGTRFKRKE